MRNYSLIRMCAIVRYLENKLDRNGEPREFISKKELETYLKQTPEGQDGLLSISGRSIDRSIEELRSMNVNIKYSHSYKGYAIEHLPEDEAICQEQQQRIVEMFNMIDVMRTDHGFSKFLHFEKRDRLGTQFLMTLLKSCQKKSITQITYHSFYKEEENKLVEPYFVKEWEGRWYLIAMDKSKRALRTYAFDRLKEVKVYNNQTFNDQFREEAVHYFDHCIGIFGSNNKKPEEVIIRCSKRQAKFVETKPLHQTQTMCEDEDGWTTFKYKICVTYDLLKELLSYGPEVVVIKPDRLREEMIDNLERSLCLYE
ncbi:WYL domain-containing protein [Halosquirtibacter xylanolyticus]|uniref:helix-turn-helix transcriptional regulator n=1 Tax=Halosquirtibacter xylanolyticus TaxID=3374599 RepID=UPI003747DF51|nr:WYL domain-containing protein [Prolixibacteraceae bacterium]